MSTAVMMERIAEASPRFRARIAGVLCLLSGVAAPATNILAHEPLYRLGAAAF